MCQEGEALSCEHGTVCVEAGAEPCVYSEPSPWLVAVSFETIYGLPIGQVERGRELSVLHHRPRSELLKGFLEMSWAPNGSTALVLSLERELGSRRELLNFGTGAAVELVPVPNVPTWGDFQNRPDFADDSSRALVHDAYSGSYLIDLRDDAEPTRLVAPVDSYSEASFCADSSAWLTEAWAPMDSVITGVVEGQVSTRSIGYGVALTSPDKRSFAMNRYDAESGELIGVELGACSLADQDVFELPGVAALAFAPDSSSLLVAPNSGGLRVVSLAGTTRPVELWSSPTAAVVEDQYFANEHLLLVRDTEGEAEPSLHIVDLTKGARAKPASLGLPSSAEVEVLGASALLAWVSLTDGAGSDLYWQSWPPKADPQFVLSSRSEDDVALIRVQGDPGALLVRRLTSGDEVQSEISVLRFDRDHFEPEFPVASLPGILAAAASAGPRAGTAAQLSSASMAFSSTLWWIPGRDEPSTTPRRLAERILEIQVQPWR
jgi:hypothetical protein